MAASAWRIRFYHLRLLTLLLLLLAAAIWRARVMIEERRPVDWDSSHHVVICPLVAPRGAWAPLKARAPESVHALEAWAAAELRRWTGGAGYPLTFSFAAAVVVDSPPPLLPAPEESWWSRFRGTDRFLAYFRARRDRFPAPAGDGSRIYLYIEPVADFLASEAVDSVGTRRGRIGIVKASDLEGDWGNTLAVILHETLHTVGALEHRNRGGYVRYPDGYADPERTPLHPQVQAEVMALGIPLTDTEELRVSALDEVVMGEATAREIGWLPPLP